MLRTILIILAFATTFVFAGECRIGSLTAKSNGNSIRIEWRTTYEVSVTRFEVERSVGDMQGFQRIDKVDAKSGGESYVYEDKDALMKGDEPKITQSSLYKYRLKIIYSDNTSEYSNPVSVTHNVSSVRRTWGMIKEMFR